MTIKTKDRDDADLDISSKPVAGVEVPQNILLNAAGTTAIDPATAGKQDDAIAALDGIADALAGRATEETLAAGIAALLSALGDLLTNTQLRASAIAVTGPLTDEQLRASALPLPTGAATQATLAAVLGALPASLGAKAGAASLSVVPASDAVHVTKERVPTVVIVSLQTAAAGATYTAFADQACDMLDVVNTAPAAVDLEVRRGGAGNTIIVPAGSSRAFVGLANANQLQVRRLDQSNAQVTFTGEAITA
ncbi:MAG: hypothetical protein IAE86_06950 [Burkholderiaceae bacterium]|nr:hypothetical protein [Burkholderiaceae bacterium]